MFSARYTAKREEQKLQENLQAFTNLQYKFSNGSSREWNFSTWYMHAIHILYIAQFCMSTSCIQNRTQNHFFCVYGLFESQGQSTGLRADMQILSAHDIQLIWWLSGQQTSRILENTDSQLIGSSLCFTTYRLGIDYSSRRHWLMTTAPIIAGRGRNYQLNQRDKISSLGNKRGYMCGCILQRNTNRIHAH